MVKIPDNLFAGETLATTLCSGTATAVSVIVVGPQKHTLAFDKDGGLWTLSADTAAWQPGAYAWQVWTESPDGKAVAGSGNLTVKPSLAAVAAGTVIDNRTTARRNIDAIEEMLTGNASAGVKSYKINNRELERYSIDELLKLLGYWKKLHRRETRGGGLGRSIRFRL